MWIRNWRSVIDFCSTLSSELLFESNGDDFQQQEQLEHLETRYSSVKLLKRNSTDDPRMRNRKLYICTNEDSTTDDAEERRRRMSEQPDKPDKSDTSDTSD